MIFIRLAFLFSVFASANLCAQTQAKTPELNNKAQAYKFDEYQKITKPQVQKKFDRFDLKLMENNDWRAA